MQVERGPAAEGDGLPDPEGAGLSGGRVSNAWGTCPVPGDNTWKQVLIPHNRRGRMFLS